MVVRYWRFIFFLTVLALLKAQDLRQLHSPPNVSRNRTIWEWCQCGTGLSSVTIYPKNQNARNFTIRDQEIEWIKFEGQISKISWSCDGMKTKKTAYVNLNSDEWISVLLFNQTKTGITKGCNKNTGKISFNIWQTTDYISSVPFTSHTEGYACFKIPTLLKTLKGTLIVFSEARSPGCDDFDRTDLVYKRSYDQGKTWSPLQVMVKVSAQDKGECGHNLVIGNISPVQLRNSSKLHPGRILAPYTRNNFKLWVTYSDDDGLTWQGNHQIPNVSQTQAHPDCNRNMSYFGFNIDQLKLRNTPDFVRFIAFVCQMSNPYKNPNWIAKIKGPWQFIGVGPSQSLQLKNGRILVPGYLSPIRGLSQVPGALPLSQLYNNLGIGFVLISDDDGDTWRLGKKWPIGQGGNQNQLVQLDDGTVISNARSLSMGSPQFRVQAFSYTNGQSFTASQFTEIPQPFAGCQGSTVGGSKGKIFVVSPNPKRGHSGVQYLTDALGCGINLNGRERLSLWISRDNGRSYKLNQIIDGGLSAQSSLQYVNGKLYLLYEQDDPLPRTVSGVVINEWIQNLRVLIPSRFVYRQLKVVQP